MLNEAVGRVQVSRYLHIDTSAVYFSVKHERKVSNSCNIQSEFTISQQEFLHSNRLDFRLESCFEAILE